jgi:hypothetical protein
MTGKIIVLDCTRVPEITVTIELSTVQMKLHAADLGKVALKNTAQGGVTATVCSAWKGHHAKMNYHLTPGKDFDGELTAISFF